MEHQLKPEEIEFMSQQQLIKISPKIKLPKLTFIEVLISAVHESVIQGSYGPFVPPREVKVPMWLALHMKKSSLCKIIPPDWLNSATLDWLQNAVKEEKKNDGFTKLPDHYLETAKNLLEWAQNDIEDSHVIRSLIMELKEIRSRKIRQGLSQLNPHVVKIDNITQMEWNEIRSFYTLAFDSLRKIESA